MNLPLWFIEINYHLLWHQYDLEQCFKSIVFFFFKKAGEAWDKGTFCLIRVGELCGMVPRECFEMSALAEQFP